MGQTASKTPEQRLITAAMHGNLAVVRQELQYNADINCTEENDCTPLSIAVYYGHVDIVRYLLSKDADIQAKTKHGCSPLHIACHKGHLNVVKHLVTHDADINDTTKEFWTPLHIACQDGHLTVVKYLVARDADIEAREKNMSTPLYIACQNGHADIVRHLVSKDAQIDAQTTNGSTPLFIACQKGHADVVTYLLSKDADISIRNKDECTSLYIASQKGHTDIVKILLARNAEVDTKNKNDSTPLHIACQNGHFEIVRSLLAKGADTQIVSKEGWTPLSIARHYENLLIVEYLNAVENDDICNKCRKQLPYRRLMCGKNPPCTPRAYCFECGVLPSVHELSKKDRTCTTCNSNMDWIRIDISTGHRYRIASIKIDIDKQLVLSDQLYFLADLLDEPITFPNRMNELPRLLTKKDSYYLTGFHTRATHYSKKLCKDIERIYSHVTQERKAYEVVIDVKPEASYRDKLTRRGKALNDYFRTRLVVDKESDFHEFMRYMVERGWFWYYKKPRNRLFWNVLKIYFFHTPTSYLIHFPVEIQIFTTPMKDLLLQGQLHEDYQIMRSSS